jgi:hypothetical protein
MIKKYYFQKKTRISCKGLFNRTLLYAKYNYSTLRDPMEIFLQAFLLR